MATGFRNLFKEYVLLDSDGVNRRSLGWIARDPQIIRRLLVTVGIMFVMSLFNLIPLPGIDLTPLNALKNGSSQQAFFAVSTRHSVSLLVWGILPFLSACSTLQFFSIFIPKLRRLGFSGEKGWNALRKYSFLLTAVISVFLGLALSLWLEKLSRQGLNLVLSPGWGFRLTAVLTLTAASMLFLWAAEAINRFGVGNGAALLAAGALPLVFINCMMLLFGYGDPGQLVLLRVVLAVFFLCLMAGVFLLAGRGKRVPIQDAGGGKIFIMLRPSMAGASALAYTQALMMMPVTIIMTFLDPERARDLAFGWSHSVWSLLATAVLVYFISYAYSLVVFDRDYVKGLLDKFGYSLADDGQGGPRILQKALSRALFPAAVFWIAMAVLPGVLSGVLGLPLAITGLFGGYYLAMFCGALSDTLSHLAFFREKKLSGIADWKVCYVAVDEIEAAVKSGFLKGQGIPALVEPLRFSLYMPVRTAVDQYRIYVPIDRAAQARGLVDK